MKTYRKLRESLPPKNVVFTFGHFNPPTSNHQSLLHFIKKLAQYHQAEQVIFVSNNQDSKKNPLIIERKLHYLQLVFPKNRFISINNIDETVSYLTNKYKNITAVIGSNLEYQKNLNKYKSIKLISLDYNPDEISKIKNLASKGLFEQFKYNLPSSIRDIDAKRLMNDVREGMGLRIIKDQIKFPFDNLREKYFRGQIYQIGTIVESITGEQLEVIKRGTNYILVKDFTGNITSKWLHEVVQEEIDA